MEQIHNKKISNHRHIRRLGKIVSAEPDIQKRCLDVIPKDGIEAAYDTYKIYSDSNSWLILEKTCKILDAFPIQQMRIAKDDLEKMKVIKNLIGGAKTVQKSIIDMGGAVTA